MAGKDGHRRSSVPAAGGVFDVGAGLAWIDSQSRYCTPERKCRVPDKWAGAALIGTVKTHDERRATGPLTPSLYGRDYEDGKDDTQSCARHQAWTYGYFGVKVMG